MAGVSLETNECLSMKTAGLTFPALALLAFSAMPATAQRYKFETPTPPGVATPDIVETSIGTLYLSNGYPDPETVTAFLYFQGSEYNLR
jgi:hypothetical protein